MPDYQYFSLKVSLITPLHIGSGEELLHEYDYAIHNGKTWRINDAALLDAQDVDNPAYADILARTPPARLLKDTDYQPQSPFFRYVIRGTPRSAAEGAVLREQLKDTFDRPYIPGSSLKGALRTAIGWQRWADLGLKPELVRLNQRKEWAAQEYDHQIFGASPNKDFLRALQVSDSQPVSPDQLMVINVRVLNRGGSLASPIELEAVRPNATFTMNLKVDLALFSDWAKQAGLQMPGEDLLKSLPAVVNAHSQQRIQREAAWFKEIPTAPRLLAFYQEKLLKNPLAANQFFLQLGWGTGWEDKTYGTRLTQDKDFKEGLIQRFHMAKGARQSGDPFPKSRRTAVLSSQAAGGQLNEVPAVPLGWMVVEMEKIS
jgi:CRISPR-associated protein Csm5